MESGSASRQLSDGEPVLGQDIAAALTAGELAYTDGATQTFNSGGTTSYVDRGRETHGKWTALGDGRFSSFWPPNYRADYDLTWIVQDGAAVGLRFREDQSGRSFDGLYS